MDVEVFSREGEGFDGFISEWGVCAREAEGIEDEEQ